MLRDIHYKTIKTKSIAFGFKLGFGSMVAILIVAITVFNGCSTEKNH